ncbi:putative tetratricopeptide-like helical domain superfamily [Plasmopara halstedii]
MVCSFMHRGVVQRLLIRGLSRSLALGALPVSSIDKRNILERSIASCEPSHALAAFETLQQDSSHCDQQLLQRLVLLVAKRGQPHQVPQAAQIFLHLLSQPNCKVDDTTQLAAIYTLDSCLRLRRLEDALLLFNAVKDRNIILDLPALNAMIEALVDAYRVDEAMTMIKSIITSQHEVRPVEQTFQSLLMALMKQKRYEDVISLVEYGRTNEVDFSPATYDPLVELSQKQYTSKNAVRMNKLMEYINNALLADGFWDNDDEVEYDDEEENDGEVLLENDDDDFDDDEFD